MPIPQSMEPMPYSLFRHSNPFLDHRQDMTSTANSGACSNHTSVMDRYSMQLHSQPEAQNHRGLIAIDPFRVVLDIYSHYLIDSVAQWFRAPAYIVGGCWFNSSPCHYLFPRSPWTSFQQVDPMALSATGLLALPPNFPPHADSIHAEIFSQKNSFHHTDPIIMLDFFRQRTIFAHGGNMERAPTIFSYARATNFPHLIPTQFGVSAPRFQSHVPQVACLVREYRIRQCWGDQQPPGQKEIWKHGHCAENQSLPSMVARCEELGLENVLIETLAMHRLGKFTGSMCKNCLSYVYICILRDHPTWRVFDVYTRNIFLIG